MHIEKILETKKLSKKFGKEYSVRNLTISVKKGDIFGFLGPNGAGKSTTMKMILGLLHPTEGEVKVFGKKLDNSVKNSVLKDVGCLIEEPSFYPNLSGLENLKLVQKLLNLPYHNIEKVLNIVKLEDQKNKLVKNYSLGMKQRLGIALALIKFPKLLILDEPTNGLDPTGIREIRELIKSLPEKYGITVLISSHLLSEIEQIANTVAIIKKGELLYEGELSKLEEQPIFEIQTNLINQSFEVLQGLGYTVKKQSNDTIQIMNSDLNKRAAAIEALVSQQIKIYEAKSVTKNLEQVFIEMTSDLERKF
ncbi:ABC transporter ATP-binding protein [Lactococcus lactis]|uniref:LctF n=1 Tax=Lactococcus lactis subsp. lactis TaxID=1360 RepID=O34113_LACLL|nr:MULTISPECIES: ABC transporter ATP-binding protein [Lactococcus]AAC72253.1 LctF [Lactococcus lactis subsp. lactis]MCT0080318.1 ABC transporter ATP-binding protein [Lactococcus lactis subsp. lactis]MDM7537972.1 ABC transporter ATP-binding protein [Lactococcus lactis]MDM7654725.1 ABC transporter ATP-binding protein [Lactococcus cremoris]MDV4193280.1 ABC transporter ATP-binding protein [Lactococcus lactis subsp. lactis]